MPICAISPSGDHCSLCWRCPVPEPGQTVGVAGYFVSQLSRRDQGKVRDVVPGPEIHGTYTDGRGFNTYRPTIHRWCSALRKQSHHARPADNVPWFVRFWSPGCLSSGSSAYGYLFRQMQARAQGARLRQVARELLTEAHGRVTFEDVAGVDEPSRISRNRRVPPRSGKFQRLGAVSARRALSARRHGKTLIARAVAANQCAILPISGSDLSRCSSASAQAACATCSNRPRRTRPASSSSMNDAVGRHRGAGLGGGNDDASRL